MKKTFVAAIFLALFSSPSLSQGMRDQVQGYSSQRNFGGRWVERIMADVAEFAVYGNGNVHTCSDDGDCLNDFHVGKINKRFRSPLGGKLTEFYIENGNLVKYECSEGALWECDGAPTRKVYPPF